MLKAIIFDFDGVITDSEILHYRSFNDILAPYDVKIKTEDYYRYYLGLSDKDFFETLIEKGFLKLNINAVSQLVRDKKVIYEQLAQTEGQIIEGVRPFLDYLSEHTIPMAICSGALLPEIELILEQATLRHHFKTIVSADQVTKSKPDPEGFLLTLQRLNDIVGPTAAEECVVFEDSYWGLEGAKEAGMRTVAVTNSYPAEQLTMADQTVKRLDTLTLDDLHNLCS
ncbi:HAD family hydrolase [Planctomycetota bacterium]